MLFTQHNFNWNILPTYQKRGSACIKTENGWKIDINMPRLVNEGREYVERFIRVEE